MKYNTQKMPHNASNLNSHTHICRHFYLALMHSIFVVLNTFGELWKVNEKEKEKQWLNKNYNQKRIERVRKEHCVLVKRLISVRKFNIEKCTRFFLHARSALEIIASTQHFHGLLHFECFGKIQYFESSLKCDFFLSFLSSARFIMLIKAHISFTYYMMRMGNSSPKIPTKLRDWKVEDKL